MRRKMIFLISSNKKNIAGPHKDPKSGKICMFNAEFLSYPLVNNWYLGSDRVCVIGLYITKRSKNDQSVYHPFLKCLPYCLSLSCP